MVSGFAKSVGDRLVGKKVEIYQGSEHDTVRRAEVDNTRKTVICGILIEVMDDCLVIEVSEGSDSVEVYVNTYSVHAILEMKNGYSIWGIYTPDERKEVK